MRMFNADGSEGEMCGNGIRCVAKYVYDHGIARKEQLKIETGRGVLTLDLQVGERARSSACGWTWASRCCSRSAFPRRSPAIRWSTCRC